MINATAEAIPKNKIFFTFLLFSSNLRIIFLLYSQYLIKRYDVRNIAGLNINQVGKGLAVLLIEAPPSKYGNVL